jgi:hypothetical protein
MLVCLKTEGKNTTRVRTLGRYKRKISVDNAKLRPQRKVVLLVIQ